MSLEDLGYWPELDNIRKERGLDSFGVGRVISEHKERYIVKTSNNEMEGEILGNLRYTAQSRSDFPAVGDWVAISEYDDSKVLIHAVLPRFSTIERQAVGKHGDKQIIATNIDYAFIVQAVDRDFNINRIERYLTLCNASKVAPIIVLNKIDLVSEDELEAMTNLVKDRIKNVPVICMSNETNDGLDLIVDRIEKGKTYCLLGSSGVGKSTLVNSLSGADVMKTNTISSSNNKGRHVTSHRELSVLKDGGILIDNPGMREVGMIDSNEGLEVTFDTIVQLSRDCKFKDCTHLQEIGCAVLSAIENGDLDENAYNNYQKMRREQLHFESTVAEKRKKDREFGKMISHHLKEKRKTKF